MALIKTKEEITLMRESGKRLAHVLFAVRDAVAPGVTTKELDLLAEKLIRATGDIPPFLDYQPYGAEFPYPASLCVSVNDEIVHGLPGDRVLVEGDIVGIDLGLAHQGMITDMAMTVPVGNVGPELEKLLRITEESLKEGIKVAKGGNRIGDISFAIESVAKTEGYGVIRELGGHGVGNKVHEDPYVPNFGPKGKGPLLKPGMILAIEPMFTLGSRFIKQLKDGYTISTRDGKYSAHFEHTVLITDGDPQVLTRR